MRVDVKGGATCRFEEWMEEKMSVAYLTHSDYASRLGGLLLVAFRVLLNIVTSYLG
jgi:hypothetical protein